MSRPEQYRFASGRTVCIALMIAIAFVATVTRQARAQTYMVIHNFSGRADGAGPLAGLTIDAAGNLYGTTWGGGDTGDGTVFKLGRKGSSWILSSLYSFAGSNDGGQPEARVVFGPDGSLYGSATVGGQMGCNGDGCGVVFNLKPPPTPCIAVRCPWTENVVYHFTGGADGGDAYSEVTFDRAGSIYGTTVLGGPDCFFRGCGVVYNLTPTGGGQWMERAVYSFSLGTDGAYPVAGVTFDNSGNLYGTTSGYTDGTDAPYGTVYELMRSGSGWTEKTLYTFQAGDDGGTPLAGVIVDQSGNLFGATSSYGAGGGGTVFKLTQSGGIWTFDTLYSFAGSSNGGPARNLVLDAAGNLYGAAHFDGADGYGSVFKLTKSGDSWTYTSLHDFTGQSDGGIPISNVVFDSEGNLYGSAFGGGAYGGGVVWQITP